MTLSLENVRALAEEYLLPVALRVLLALAIFVVGRWIAKAILRALDRVMERSKLDVSLRSFLGDVCYAMLLVAVAIASLDTVGIKTTAVVAVLGAAGLAVGLALQGSLSNFAAGVMLIVLRPYKVGDTVTIGKYLGRIDSIKVFHTVLITPDNREIAIPNATIIAQPIENFTVLGRRRVDLIVAITAPADLAHVRTLLDGALHADDRIEKGTPSSIDLAEVSDAGIKLQLRPWTRVDHYAEVTSAALERIRGALADAGIKFSVTIAPTA